MSSKDFELERDGLDKELGNVVKDLRVAQKEAARVQNILENTKNVLDDLDRQFCEATKLNRVDIAFLFFAVALQCLRQYLLSDDKFRFKTDGQAYKFIKDPLKKWGMIDITGPVPYDAFKKTGIDINTGISGVNHRYTTLGHDPLLGWIFGVANILTDTVTKNNIFLESYHTTRVGNEFMIDSPTTVVNILMGSVERVKAEPLDLGLAVAKHAVHLGSDAFTKMGLPIPVINTISPQLSGKLMKSGIDLYGVGRNMAVASLINMIIAAIHGLFYDESKYKNRDLYEVKTRKILSYSNLIASASNIIYVTVSVFLGNEGAVRQLDIGGIIVTIYRLITDAKFISEVKAEFIFGSYRELIEGNF